MAQLFPGAVTVLFVTAGYLVVTAYWAGTVVTVIPSLSALFSLVGNIWFASNLYLIIFLFFSVATGMFLHGLGWMILGWETCGWTDGKLDENKYVSVREFSFHCKALWKQIFLGPLWMFVEILNLLRVPGIKWVALEENVSKTNPDAMPVFTWLQDFYLYFAQFYVHMSYALLIGWVSAVVTVLAMGLSIRRILFLLALYALTSLFFLMGRTQMATLFLNEGLLQQATAATDEPQKFVVHMRP